MRKTTYMKTKLVLFTALLILGTTACDQEETAKEITVSSISFNECSFELKTTIAEVASVHLKSQADNMLLVQMNNTEFCCGADSVSINYLNTENQIQLEIIDKGPHTHCFCERDLEFILGPLSLDNYTLTLIESEHSYVRDTLQLTFDYTQQLDTTISANKIISSDPMNYSSIILGGCNNMNKIDVIEDEPGKDTLIFYELPDTLRIFAGLNAPCCIEYDTESSFTGDTLVMQVNTLNDDHCDCICYYTFDFFYSEYTGQGFCYQFFLDEAILFEGNYNIP
jgi:hypothetical protein